MPYPMKKMRSITNRKNDFNWLASIKNIFINLLDIIKLLFRWR